MGFICVEIVLKFLAPPTEPIRAIQYVLKSFWDMAEEWASKKLFKNLWREESRLAIDFIDILIVLNA